RFYRRDRRDQGLENLRGDRRAGQPFVAASISTARRWRLCPAMPDMRQWPLIAQAEQIRRFHRLLQLPGVPLYATALDPGRRFGGDWHQGARFGSAKRPRSDAAQRPFRSLFAAWRSRQWREAAARWPAEGYRARSNRSAARSRT